jgi:dihydropteroate synthase
MTNWQHATGTLSLDKPRIFGIVNVTPDSFSDGGRLRSVDDARRLIDQLLADGADAIDIGGESTRPQGARPVSVDEELGRVVPVVVAAVRDHPGTPISIDTVKAPVAAECLAAGAAIVNDVAAFRLDPDLPRVCASANAGVVLMHSRGDVADMATFAHATYGDDPVGEIVTELTTAIDAATAARIPRERIVLDPGIGFSKTSTHSLAVLRELSRLAALGFPIMVGVSRKRFIGELTHVSTPADRVAGTVGANVAALERGARLFRVHDVRANREALDVAWAITEPAAAQ